MNIETKLLAALLAGSDENEIRKLAAQNCDWRIFVKSAADHRIAPLIYQKIENLPNALNAELSAEIQLRTRNISLRNLNLIASLHKLAELFQANGIKFLSYKGAALACLAYGETSGRQFGDLDILIDKKDFPATKKILLENGAKPAWKLSAKQEKAVLNHYYEFPFVFGEDSVMVEIHWSLMESFFGFNLSTDEIFSRSQMVWVQGKMLETLSNEDLLVFLCVHGAKHFWQRLGWICDVGLLVQNQPVDWDKVEKICREKGCRRMLLLGLKLAQNVLQIALPERLISQIESDKKVFLLAVLIEKRIFAPDFPAPNLQTGIHLKMRERWRDKFAFSRRLLITKLVDSMFMPMGRPR